MTFTIPTWNQNSLPDYGAISGQKKWQQASGPYAGARAGQWWWSPSGSINDPGIQWSASDPNGGGGSSYAPPPGSIAAGGPGPNPGLSSPTPTNPLSDAANPVNDVAQAQAQSSARAIIDGALGQYGLQSLSTWAWGKYLANESIDQIMLELRQTPEYKTRFPAMETLAQSGHAISEAQYIDYETGASNIFKANGLPSSFYDQPQDFAQFLTNNVALPELQTRVQMYRDAAFNTPPEIRQHLQDFYGVSPGELTAFFIDPDKALPLITQRYNAATAAGYATTTGYGPVTQSEAERVAQFGLSAGQLQAGFGRLAGESELFNPLLGTTDQGVGRAQGLNAEFGQNAADQVAIESERANRLATFKGGGGFAETAKGVVGVGSASY